MTYIQRPKLDKWFEQADELLALSIEIQEEAAQDRSDDPPAQR